jgi:hypothetical protein
MLAGLSNPKRSQTYVESRRLGHALSFSFSPFRENLTGRDHALSFSFSPFREHLTGRDHADGARGRTTTAACRGEQEELRRGKGPIG